MHYVGKMALTLVFMISIVGSGYTMIALAASDSTDGENTEFEKDAKQHTETEKKEVDDDHKHDDEHHDHKDTKKDAKLHPAHTHGVAQLDIAKSASTVSFHLNIPLFDLVGFGHKPKKPSEKSAIKTATAKLQADKLFVAPAGCKLASSKHNIHHGESHADVIFHAEYKCDSKQKNKALKLVFSVQVGEVFSKIETVKVTVASDKAAAYNKKFQGSKFDITL